jgi:thioredoxin reductase (NADPH)
MAQFYDAIIIGSGPAGLTAAIYLGRAGQKCVLLEKDFVGGYTAKIAHVENYPGYESISGMDLTQIMARQAEKFGATILYPVEVIDMELKGEVKRIRTREEVYEGHVVIIAIGVARKKLEVPGANEFLGKGVSYCATCDGNFFKGRTDTSGDEDPGDRRRRAGHGAQDRPGRSGKSAASRGCVYRHGIHTHFVAHP